MKKIWAHTFFLIIVISLLSINIALAQEDRTMLDMEKDLRVASRIGNARDVIQLIAEGVDVNSEITYAERHPVVCSILSCPDEANEPPVLVLAVNLGRTDIVEVLLNVGADPDMGYPLHSAAVKDHADIARILISAGSDINAIIQGSTFAPNGNTPLHLAALYESLNVMEILLTEGADLSIRNDEGHTPIDIYPL